MINPDDLKEKYIEETRAKFNHICLLFDCELVRCIGFSEDILDYYYIVKDMNGKISHATFVGACTSLKDNYPRYEQLENIFNLSNSIAEEEFRIEVASDADNWKMYKIKTINGEEDVEWMDKYRKLMREIND